ncbi:MAG TPA: hypothetical protein VI039_08665 [Solirubrobacterales bacterium]
MRWEDGAVYALVLAGIYLLLGVLFFYAGKEKIIDGDGAPPPIEKQFSVLIGLVLLMPPYRVANWISGRGDS